jgi:AraC-like DNA-binding protein
MQDEVAAPMPAIKPCSAAMGILGTPAVRWRTKADLFEQLERARIYLETCDLEESCITDAAAAAGISVHHFVRLFHERYGTTPHAYLCQRRARIAEALLRSSEMSVTEIALETGFRERQRLRPMVQARVQRNSVGLPQASSRRVKVAISVQVRPNPHC